jgi:acyl transferase domain-containing protein/acyl carrier protein
MRNSENGYEGDPSEHVAIIGMTGRFPGARNIDQFWQNLCNGVESISFFTDKELSASNIDQALLHNPKFVSADGVIDDMDMFDAEFFNYTPREAEILDPQHRLFLECAWEVMESAGYDSESYDGRVGVYASANLSSYLIRNILSNPDLRESATSFQTMLGNDKDFVATRVSHKMNLTGPSINVATLCSSSFVAIHLACQSLLTYQCDLAMAGSISLQVSRNEAFFYQEGGIGDPDGHCRAFDAKASGTVSGSGLGIVVLKRLEDALVDGDYIRAVIRGAAVNNDGALKVSYTAPSVEGQARVIAEALALAEVDPETITYVETHGTGTRLGDPIEIEALTRAFRASTQKKGFCAIGSVKTNIGHLVNAGGVASLIKTILAFEHKQIPPSLNFEEPNPQIDFENSPFYVATELLDWETSGAPRRAGVSSFGIGGTNVHLVVEEAPEIEPSGESRPWHLLLLSARTSSALARQTTNLIAHLKQLPNINLADVAFTLQVGRRAFEHRRMLLCRDVQDAVSALSTTDSERVLTQFQESKDRPVAFMFPGLGKQYVNMVLELYQSEPTFREQVDLCAEMLKPYLSIDLRKVMYPGVKETEQAQQQLERPVIAHAALFVLENALATLWMEWGVRPQTMIGDGVGEYVAACLAGVFSLEDALALTIARGQAESGGDGLGAFTAQLERITLGPPLIPYVSSVTGAQITKDQTTDLDYWSEQLNQVYHFAKSMEQLLKGSERVLLEVGPGQTLGKLAMEHPGKAEHQVVLPSMSQQQAQSDVAFMLDTLGKLWLAGVRVDWNGFHVHEHRHRLPLPTYPFERQRYWVEPLGLEERRVAGDLRPKELLTTKKPDIADWFYIPSWERSLWPAHRAEETSVQSPWLLFVDECGLGARLIERLEREGQDVIKVKVGTEFARLDDGVFTLNPRNQTDYGALLEELAALETRPQRLAHLWSITENGNDVSALERIGEAQDLGFYSLLFLSQALGELDYAGDLQITVVSNCLHQVTAADELYPEKATMLGLIKVIPQEYPNISCRSIDVVLPESESRQEYKLVEHLWAELAGNSVETAVAYRGLHRWVQTFEPVRLDESLQVLSRLREEGVYLIFGGLEGIGLVLAKYLARTVKAKLILTMDLELPTRDAWASWLSTHDADSDVSCQIRKLQELETLGVQVLPMTANVSHQQQVEAVVTKAVEHFGHLDGVVYAAGSFGRTSFDFIKETDKSKCEQQFQRTIYGLLALEKALSSHDLDFCLLVSSLSSVLGGLGLGAYAAANSFLDAFTHQNNRTHTFPWISANWDNWKFGRGHEKETVFSSHLEDLAMTPTEGVDAFERILSCGDVSQLIISTVDLQARIDQWITRESMQEGDEPGKERMITFHVRPNLPTPFVAPRSKIEQTIADIWQRLVGVEPIGIHDNFFELGGDSLLAVQIISRVRETFYIDLSLGSLFEQPTVAFLAEYVEAIRWAAQGSQPAPAVQGDGREEIEL